MQIEERILLGQKSVRKLQITLKLLLLFFYFAKWLSLVALFETEKHIEAKLCSILQTAYCKLPFLCFVGVYLYESVKLQEGYISLHNTSPPTMKATGCEIVILGYTEIVILGVILRLLY